MSTFQQGDKVTVNWPSRPDLHLLDGVVITAGLSLSVVLLEGGGEKIIRNIRLLLTGATPKNKEVNKYKIEDLL